MNIHGGYWRARYDLGHSGHFCAALTAKGVATWNVEYRRVGNRGGGWPGTLEDVCKAWRFILEVSADHDVDTSRALATGHSAGGQLALYLAAQEASVWGVVSLGGVVNLHQAWAQHLSAGAVAEFLGGSPEEVPERYRSADPMQLAIKAKQRLIHGAADEVVPADLSRGYVAEKKTRGEDVEYMETSIAGHFDLIDPRSGAWREVENVILNLLRS